MQLAPLSEISSMAVPERIVHFKAYIVAEKERAKELHESGAKGLEVCTLLSESFDRLITVFYELAQEASPEMSRVALVANGGYGRAQMFAGSDIDLLFLLPKPSTALSKSLKVAIDVVLYGLWDLNLKVGHAVRSIGENITEGKQDAITRTTLLDSRLVVGDAKLFGAFQKRYRKEAILNDKANFFKERSADLQSRYVKFQSTVFLQEPNIKESPGALRDWHNLLWLGDTVTDHREVEDLTEAGVVSETAAIQIQDSVDFLMRLRHELHFRTGKGVDLLSLRMQGEVAQAFNYPGDDILLQIEALMKDYYTHARNLYNRVRGAFEMMDLEMEAFREQTLTSWLPWVNRKVVEDEFDGFVSRDGLLFAMDEAVFENEPARLLRIFWHCQNYSLSLSPSLRKLVKGSLHLMTDDFCRSEEQRQAIENIMGMRGRVGVTLRAMHRVGVLGRMFPEFGALDCLVQHEFFHRYTADEHTLRCIDYLDRVANETDPNTEIFSDLFQAMEDPYALYFALILHDTGRALNTDDHVDGSHVLAVQACDRLKIQGERRRLILFLVDHHLTLFNIGTKKDIDDPEVIEGLCREIKTVDRLEALFVFTYCDSNGTNPDGWSGWKSLAISTLYKRASNALAVSSEEAETYLNGLLEEQKVDVRKRIVQKYWPSIEGHFQEMPRGYFRYRTTKSIAKHVKAIWQYENRRARRPDTPFEAAVQWVEHESLGYSEVGVVTHEKKNLLASICCAMAKHGINILSANVHTRSDGIVLDLFRVCDMEQEAVVDKIHQMEVVTTIYALNAEQAYDPSAYIKEHKNLMDTKPMLVVIPEVDICNDEHEAYTSVEVQATDRIGLLHDLLSLFAELNLITKGARITTERNTAIDTFLIANEAGEKIDESTVKLLKERVLAVAKN